MKDIILENFLAISNLDDKFSHASFIKAIHTSGLQYNIISAMFPNNEHDLIEYFIKLQNNDFLQYESFTSAVLSNTENIFENIIAYYTIIRKYILYNPVYGTRILYILSDKIIHNTNMHDLDFKFYSKRVALMKILYTNFCKNKDFKNFMYDCKINIIKAGLRKK